MNFLEWSGQTFWVHLVHEVRKRPGSSAIVECVSQFHRQQTWLAQVDIIAKQLGSSCKLTWPFRSCRSDGSKASTAAFVVELHVQAIVLAPKVVWPKLVQLDCFLCLCNKYSQLELTLFFHWIAQIFLCIA